jgi:hypothetical protein
VKNLLISLCGYEIEMWGILEKYVKETTTLVWGFIWGGGINQGVIDVLIYHMVSQRQNQSKS